MILNQWCSGLLRKEESLSGLASKKVPQSISDKLPAGERSRSLARTKGKMFRQSGLFLMKQHKKKMKNVKRRDWLVHRLWRAMSA